MESSEIQDQVTPTDTTTQPPSTTEPEKVTTTTTPPRTAKSATHKSVHFSQAEDQPKPTEQSPPSTARPFSASQRKRPSSASNGSQPLSKPSTPDNGNSLVMEGNSKPLQLISSIQQQQSVGLSRSNANLLVTTIPSAPILITEQPEPIPQPTNAINNNITEAPKDPFEKERLKSILKADLETRQQIIEQMVGSLGASTQDQQQQQIAKEKQSRIQSAATSVFAASVGRRSDRDGWSAFSRCSRGPDGRYLEIPHLLDGFLILNRAESEEPSQVYSVKATDSKLTQVMEEDLTLFTELHTLNVSENALPFEKLGILPNLRCLQMAFNQVADISSEALSRFLFLEELDLSYNKLSQNAITILSVFQNLKKLDLASNELREFPRHVADLRKWNQVDEQGDNDAIPQTLKPIPGFVKLHTLVLENNQLSDPGLFMTLKDMPNLRVLNLNHNKFTTLDFLTPSTFLNQPNMQSSTDLTHTSTSSLFPQSTIRPDQKFNGFHHLEELCIAFNQIQTPEGLLAMVWLPALKKCWIEGNPVIKKRNEAVLMMSNDSSKQPELISFEPTVLLPRIYNIQILDRIYNKHPTTLNKTHPTFFLPSTGHGHPATIKPLIKPMPIPKHTKAQEITRKYLPPITKRPTHVVLDDWKYRADEGGVNKYVEARKQRREMKLSDKDVEEMVKHGRILGLKEFESWRDKAETFRKGMAGDEVHSQEDEQNDSDAVVIPQVKPETNANAAVGVKNDATFLTGLDIFESAKPTKVNHEEPVEMEDELGGEIHERREIELEEEEFQAAKEVMSNPVPSSIQGSIRALRHALNNPTMYWKLVDENYKKQTIASQTKQRDRAFTDTLAWAQDFRKRMTTGSRSRQSTSHQLRKDDVVSSQQFIVSLQNAMNTPLPSMEPLGGTKKAKKDNCMDDLQDMMNTVDLKLRLVEMNLGNVMTNTDIRQKLSTYFTQS